MNGPRPKAGMCEYLLTVFSSLSSLLLLLFLYVCLTHKYLLQFYHIHMDCTIYKYSIFIYKNKIKDENLK